MSWIAAICRRLTANWSAGMAAARAFQHSDSDAGKREATEWERFPLTPWWM